MKGAPLLNDDESTRGAARADLRFFGRVTAGVSHEITNIFTIIGEFAGLLNDLVALTEKGRPLAPETVKRAADNAFTSSLPKARAVLSALELLAEAGGAFRLAATALALPELLPGLPGGGPKISVLWLLLLASAAMTVSLCRRPETRLALSSSRQSSIEVLRC